MSLKKQVEHIKLLIINNDWHENKESEKLIMKLLSNYYQEFDSKEIVNQEYFKEYTYNVYDIIHLTFGYKVDEEFEDLLKEAKDDNERQEFRKDYEIIKKFLRNLYYIKTNIRSVENINEFPEEMMEALKSVKDYLDEMRKDKEEFTNTIKDMTQKIKELSENMTKFFQTVEENPININTIKN